MILLLDTDVLIDFALDRKPYSADAGALIEWLEGHPGSAAVAWHSLSNFHYLVAPERGRGEARDFLRDLTRLVAIAPTTLEHFDMVIQLPMSDFEDALQVAAALAARADRIVTRNLRDFARSPVKAVTPAAALRLVSRLAG